MRGVPLALVVGPVAAGPEPVAHRRHVVRRQPEHVVAVVALGQPGRLRHTVQRRMVPRQQRGATRRARGADRIVVLERDPVRAQALLTRAVLPAVRRQLIRLIRRRMVQLVGHHQQDVRATILGRLAHRGSFRAFVSAPSKPNEAKPGRTRWHQPQRVMRRWGVCDTVQVLNESPTTVESSSRPKAVRTSRPPSGPPGARPRAASCRARRTPPGSRGQDARDPSSSSRSRRRRVCQSSARSGTGACSCRRSPSSAAPPT